MVSAKASESLLSGSIPDCDGGLLPESTLSVQTVAVLRTLLGSSLGKVCCVGARKKQMRYAKSENDIPPAAKKSERSLVC